MTTAWHLLPTGRQRKHISPEQDENSVQSNKRRAAEYSDLLQAWYVPRLLSDSGDLVGSCNCSLHAEATLHRSKKTCNRLSSKIVGFVRFLCLCSKQNRNLGLARAYDALSVLLNVYEHMASRIASVFGVKWLSGNPKVHTSRFRTLNRNSALEIGANVENLVL